MDWVFWRNGVLIMACLAGFGLASGVIGDLMERAGKDTAAMFLDLGTRLIGWGACIALAWRCIDYIQELANLNF